MDVARAKKKLKQELSTVARMLLQKRDSDTSPDDIWQSLCVAESQGLLTIKLIEKYSDDVKEFAKFKRLERW